MSRLGHCIHNTSLALLSPLAAIWQSKTIDVISCVQQHMVICSCQGRQRQHTDLAVSPSPDLVSGISYLRLCVYHRPLDSFKASWRQYFFARPTRHDSARSWLLRLLELRVTNFPTYLLTYLRVEEKNTKLHGHLDITVPGHFYIGGEIWRNVACIFLHLIDYVCFIHYHQLPDKHISQPECKIYIAHRREHASDALPLLVHQRWSPLASHQPGIQWTLRDHRHGLVCHAICLFTPPAFAGYSFQPNHKGQPQAE